MRLLTSTEENYLKALLKLILKHNIQQIGTNALASVLQLRPATVNDMLKKLKEKELVEYKKYGKITLTEEGKHYATQIMRKHRLWETFLHNTLGFTWDEVHEVAEQLEHVHSEKLIEQLDKFLGFPQFDPHGDPIPSASGEIKPAFHKTLAQSSVGKEVVMVSVKDNSSVFLQYVVRVGLGLHCKIKIVSKQLYDALMVIEVNGLQHSISEKFAENILVEPYEPTSEIV